MYTRWLQVDPMINLPCKLEKQINNLSIYGEQGLQFGIEGIFLSNCRGTLDVHLIHFSYRRIRRTWNYSSCVL